MAENELNEIRKELKLLVAVFAAVAVAMKVAYSNEGIMEVLRTSASLFWLFVLPGYFMTLYWKDKLGFIERTVMGSTAAMAVVGITSYYLGIAGLKLQSQTVLLPAAIIAVSFAACARKSRQRQQAQAQPERIA